MRQQILIITPKFMGTQKQLGKVDESAAVANFLILLVKRDLLSPVRVIVVVEMLRAQTLVFLGIDEILNFTRHPAIVIELKVLYEPLYDSKLIIGVNDLKVLW
jgi:hypothetical protein